MDVKDLINWSALSTIISGNSESIRRARIPAKYEYQVNIYLKALIEANDKLRQFEIQQHKDNE